MSVLKKDETPMHIPPSQQLVEGAVPKPGEPLEPRMRKPAPPTDEPIVETEVSNDPSHGITRRPGVHRTGAKK